MIKFTLLLLLLCTKLSFITKVFYDFIFNDYN